MQFPLTANSAHYSLSKEQVTQILSALGSGSPRSSPDGKALIFQTVCHNPPHQGSFKLFYYLDNGLFHCYTHCGDSFDIYELVMRSKECGFYQALLFIQGVLGFILERKTGIQRKIVDDWQIIEKYASRAPQSQQSLPEYPLSVLDYYKPVFPVEWLRDRITPQAMKRFQIRFDPVKDEIIIPHFDMSGRLVGIRSRLLDFSAVSAGFKYMPTSLEGTDFRHPLRSNLYGLYQNLQAIQRCGKVVLFEAEKSVLQCAGYYGDDNFTTAVCGSNISHWQRDTLLSLGVREVFLAFDKEYHTPFTPESDAYADKVLNLASLFTPYVTTYVLWDMDGLLDYKDSPSDKGRGVLEQLMAKKIEVTTEE